MCGAFGKSLNKFHHDFFYITVNINYRFMVCVHALQLIKPLKL